MICSQDQLYVQNVELARFSAQFRDVATKFAENEKTIRSLQVMGSNLYEVSLAVGGHRRPLASHRHHLSCYDQCNAVGAISSRINVPLT